MMRHAILYRFVLVLTLIYALGHSAYALAADPGREPASSVEQLRALLRSIDPYYAGSIEPGTIHVFGTDAMDGLAHAWGENFRGFHPDMRFEFTSLNEDKSAAQILSEPTGIWMLSRPVSPEELDALKTKGLTRPVAFEVARQALGVFVHASNPVQTISGEQLRHIFTAEAQQVPTWRLLGVEGDIADKPINIIARQGNSGTQRFLRDIIFKTQLREGSPVESNAKVVDAIKGDPLAIGICDLRCGGNEARPLQLQAGGNLIPSDDLAILTGQYPLVRPLSIVVDLGNPDRARIVEFLRYILSQSGQAENVLAGYFPVDLPRLRAEIAELNAPLK